MSENELNDIQGEVPAIPAAEEEVPETKAPEAEAPEKQPDDAPDPATLKAEIEQLKADKEAAKEAAQKWRREKAEARADFFKNRGEPAPAATPAPAAATKPDPDAFDDYNDYVEALTDFKVEAKRREWDQAEATKAQSATHQTKMQNLREKINAGYESYSDFEDVALAETVPITSMVMEALAETDNPADIAYYLGKNRTECIAISKMTPIAAARAIAKIETQLSGGNGNPAPKPTKKTTSAPPPIKPVGSSNTVAKDPEKMTQAEFEAYRISQGARRF